MKLRIDEPCHEDWNKMKIGLDSRHCDMCAKNVVDFTQKSRAEIIAYMLSTDERVCGRLRPDQFDFRHEDIPVLVDVMERQKTKNPFLILALVCISLSSYQAVGQQETGTIQTPPATEQVISLGEITPVSTVDTIQPVRPVKGKVVCEPAEPVEQGEIIMGDIAAPEPEIDEANKVHQFAEIMPKYKGGMIAMMDHLSNYIMTKDLDVHVLGTIYVRFVVERDGSLSGFEVMHGFNEAYFQMAMEAAKSMPNWEPGTINGKAVRVYTTVPVRFEP